MTKAQEINSKIHVLSETLFVETTYRDSLQEKHSYVVGADKQLLAEELLISSAKVYGYKQFLQSLNGDLNNLKEDKNVDG